jgi:hypothetical protein
MAHLGLTRVAIAQVVDFRVTPNTLTSSLATLQGFFSLEGTIAY